MSSTSPLVTRAGSPALVPLGRSQVRGGRRKKVPELESKIEDYLLEECTRHGFMCLKFISPGTNGVPDRVVISPTKTVFIEVKRPGGALRRLQGVITAEMRAAGAEVHLIDTRHDVDRLIAQLCLTLPSAAVGS